MDWKRGQRINGDTAGRFSNRVENYRKYRPGYPTELFDFLRSEVGLTGSWKIADIGSGTGISARPFLEYGNTLFAVEPNEAMRNTALCALGKYDKFKAVAGIAEETGLPRQSIDLVFAAQSFHWFCNPEAVKEIRRILRKDGFVCIVWNERVLGSDPFHKEYESLVRNFATDYLEVRHDKFTRVEIERAFCSEFLEAEFDNSQALDREGLKGRILSSSYMPDESSPLYPFMLKNVDLLFDKHKENDRISVSYKTKLYYSKF